MEEPSRYVYRSQDLAQIDDVHTTWEWYGGVNFDGDVRNALFPYPWFLMTPKVMRLLRDPNDKAVNWLAVRVEEGSFTGPCEPVHRSL